MIKAINLGVAIEAFGKGREILLERFGVTKSLIPSAGDMKQKYEVACADEDEALWLVSLKEDDRLIVEFFVDDQGRFLWVKKISLRQEGSIILQMIFEEEFLTRFSIFKIPEVGCLGPMGSLLLEIIGQDRRLLGESDRWIDIKTVSDSASFKVGRGKGEGSFLRRIAA